jgi:hypothetical protein
VNISEDRMENRLQKWKTPRFKRRLARGRRATVP